MLPKEQIHHPLTLLHSEWPKLYALSAIGLREDPMLKCFFVCVQKSKK